MGPLRSVLRSARARGRAITLTACALATLPVATAAALATGATGATGASSVHGRAHEANHPNGETDPPVTFRFAASAAPSGKHREKTRIKRFVVRGIASDVRLNVTCVRVARGRSGCPPTLVPTFTTTTEADGSRTIEFDASELTRVPTGASFTVSGTQDDHIGSSVTIAVTAPGKLLDAVRGSDEQANTASSKTR